ncbi:ABC-type branched-subunit amino acid transport system substrate-binding protein [Erythromicrobium ramosum]|uniref:ABC-type branched-subunit amino acid transport system substrate-binding protein n=2 Tax=Erythrobacter ramosus TaxID=35811 RepID=A0ABR6HZH4_9SPHN|nr:penicillin-binding protein activator [Erythrobacter ramosus]MBB3776061.1 ABC-type branched-subunit amino acid transport system substrate-binding protein [Erythrobacter ramosus]
MKLWNTPVWAGWLMDAARHLRGRNVALAGAAMLAAGCQVIPKTDVATAPPPAPAPEPSATALPTDTGRHRIALLVPMSGDTAAVGQAIANATTMALLDTTADNLRITTYDTSEGVATAARKAIADGNKLILGPLTADAVPAVQAAARPAGVPVIAFANDAAVAGPDVFVIGHMPEQSIRRTVAFARSRGAARFAVLVPEGDYGARAFSALENSLRDYGGSLVRKEGYARGNTSIVSAAARLRAAGGYDTVLVADSARLGIDAAAELQRGVRTRARILGTELWSGDAALARAPALEGALFAAVSDQRYKRFADSYAARFGAQPYRTATLGYDAVLLTLRVARDWKVGTPFPKSELYDKGGFLGVDGAFRFTRNGVIERALEVREIKGGEVTPVDPAPTGFGK